ncbi:MAG: DUF1156 domain-containing protein, partial [Planctomycetaceae bacterium]|nr:DUF1156 domain-containing protein [Planctomycetaceae bacterium]
LVKAAHPDETPLVVDPFAGGGSIPLEALRVGADAFASDLNPVAVLLNKVVLEYIPKYGNAEIKMQDADGKEVTFHGLAEAVRYWGNWVKEQAEQELAEFYPKDPDGSTPIAYLWARTILSEAPGQGDIPVEVPLIRSLWLCKKPKRKVALRWVRDKSGTVQTETVDVTYADGVTRTVRRPLLEIFEPKRDSEVEGGTVARGSATCPVTGYTTPVASVRRQMASRRGGADDSRLTAVVTTRDGEQGRFYRLPQVADYEVCHDALEHLRVHGLESEAPTEETPRGGGSGAGRAFSQQNYGMVKFADLFAPRQRLSLITLTRRLRELQVFHDSARPEGVGSAIAALLALLPGKQADLGNALCRWEPVAQCPRQLFGRQAISIVWDFAEGVPIGESSGSWEVIVRNAINTLEGTGSDWLGGTVQQADAANHPLLNDMCDAVFTDPPYYDAVPYSDLSDFFFVWFRRSLPGFAPGVGLTPKAEECIVDDAKGKSAEFFENTMETALRHSRRIVKPNGIGTVVFAHKTTGGWESQLQAMLTAGWTFTASWPVDTECGSRLRAMNSAALASSVHLVCRPREDAEGNITESVGEWRDVLSELPKRIHEWMPRLAAEGVVGADAIFACLGPALEIFSRYSSVEKANGETATLREYLEFVWAAVSTEALSLIFKEADASGLEPDARLTAMWLWTLGGGGTNGNGKGPHPGPLAEGEGEETDEDDEESGSS